MSEDKKNGKQNKTVKPFDPMTLRGVTVRNRIWLPPMDTYSALAQDGKPTPFHYQHYVSRSMGGFGMIIMEATAVAPEGRISPCDLGLWDDGQMDAWRWIVADAKAAGATMAVQLNHAGRKGSTGCHAIGFDGQSVPEEQGGWRTVCPSANAYGSLARPRALSVDEIHTIVDQFRDAAWRAMNIGFDAVEVHAAHGSCCRSSSTRSSTSVTTSTADRSTIASACWSKSWMLFVPSCPIPCRCWCASPPPTGPQAVGTLTRPSNWLRF